MTLLTIVACKAREKNCMLLICKHTPLCIPFLKICLNTWNRFFWGIGWTKQTLHWPSQSLCWAFLTVPSHFRLFINNKVWVYFWTNSIFSIFFLSLDPSNSFSYNFHVQCLSWCLLLCPCLSNVLLTYFSSSLLFVWMTTGSGNQFSSAAWKIS